jgi:hypothetical protein
MVRLNLSYFQPGKRAFSRFKTCGWVGPKSETDAVVDAQKSYPVENRNRISLLSNQLLSQYVTTVSKLHE